MPSHHLAYSSYWRRPKLLFVFDELSAKHFVPDLVRLSPAVVCGWLNEWEHETALFGRLVGFIEGDGAPGYLADGGLYEKLVGALDGQTRPPSLELAWRGRAPSDLPNGHVNRFLRTLFAERTRYLRGEQFISRIAANQGTLLYYPERQLPKHMFQHPAVLLNAAADVGQLRMLLETPDYPVTEFSPHVDLHGRTAIEYVLDANHSWTTVYRSGYGSPYTNAWLRRIRGAMGHSDRALLVATKSGKKMLRSVLRDLPDDQVASANYGATSGLNVYTDCDVAVLSEPFFPNPVAVAGLYRSLSGGEPGLPLDLRTCFKSVQIPWRDDDGNGWEVSVRTMRDERLAPMYDWWRWSEMFQAAHRVRPILNQRRVVVLCAIPVEGLAPTSVTYTPRRAKTLGKLVGAAERLR
jgi:hypothetical protein